MANLRDIQRRIRSVKNTSQITRAMQLVASSKMKKAQNQALNGRGYVNALGAVLAHLDELLEDSGHPLLSPGSSQRELCLVISTDKGLCGPINTNLLRKIRQEVPNNTAFVTIGRKLRGQLAKTGADIIASWSIPDPVPIAAIYPIATFLRDKFVNGEFSRISVAFTGFKNTMVQIPLIRTLLPLNPDDLKKLAASHSPAESTDSANTRQYILEPSPEKVFEALLPLFAFYALYQMVLESRASEHSSRMVAMKSATDNASELISDLTLEFNKLRQTAITTELLEMSTAMSAME